MGSSEETYSDFVCPKGTHVFKQDKCMICPICHQCTGYGAECQLARRNEEREPGEWVYLDMLCFMSPDLEKSS